MDMVRIEAVGLSRLGIMPDQCMTLSPRELFLALQDVQELANESMKLQFRVGWEYVRTTLFYIHNMNPYRKKALRKASDLMKFDWDTDHKQPMQSIETMKQMLINMHVANHKRNKQRKKK